MKDILTEKVRLAAVVSVLALGILVIVNTITSMGIIFDQSVALGMLVVLFLACAAGLFLSTGKRYHDAWKLKVDS